MSLGRGTVRIGAACGCVEVLPLSVMGKERELKKKREKEQERKVKSERFENLWKAYID